MRQLIIWTIIGGWLSTHICVTRPHWVKWTNGGIAYISIYVSLGLDDLNIHEASLEIYSLLYVLCCAFIVLFWLYPQFLHWKEMSFWRNLHHWLHRKLSKWQLHVHPVTKVSSKMTHLRFSVTDACNLSHLCEFSCFDLIFIEVWSQRWLK